MTQLLDHHGLAAIAIEAKDGARAVVTLHGGHVVSWTPAGGDEMLYCSPRSAYAAGQAIRGGVPVIFPQFSHHGPLPRHGFARVLPWQQLPGDDGEEPGCARLRLVDNHDTRLIWPHAFELELLVRVGADSLTMGLSCLNTGPTSFQFTSALHTYLRTTNVEQLGLAGLVGCRYLDAVDGHTRTQAADVLHVDGELDRVYLQPTGPIVLRHGPLPPRLPLVISQQGFVDAVVWNPGVLKCGKLADMPADGWRDMICVEAACVEQPLVLQPGQRWVGQQTLQQQRDSA